MSELTPNSHKYRAEQKNATNEKRVEKVIKGSATTKQKSEIRKFADEFIAEDAHNVKSYVWRDVIVPAAKKLVFDIVRDGVEMLLYGVTGGTRNDGRRDSNYVSYSSKYNDRRDNRGPSVSYAESRLDFGEIRFTNKGDALAVLDEMDITLRDFGIVRVSDMFDMAGMTPPYTSNRYGWSSLRNAEIVRVRDGYIIKMPRPIAID